MYYLSDMCGLCLSKSGTFKNIHTESDPIQTLTYYEKIISYLPEIEISVDQNSNFLICQKCCETINMVYDFNMKCLYSANTVSKYIDILKGSKPNTKSNLTVKIERLKKYETKATEPCHTEIFIKTEPELNEPMDCNEDPIHINEIPMHSGEIPTHSKEIPMYSTEIPTHCSEIPMHSREILVHFNENPMDSIGNPSHSSGSSMHFSGNEPMHFCEMVTVKTEPDTYFDESESTEIYPEFGTDDFCTKKENPSNESLDSHGFGLPEKSKERYENNYRSFKHWCNEKNVEFITENIMLEYFMLRTSVLKSPGSLWAEYSMLKNTILRNDNLDISTFKNLIKFLKQQNIGYKKKEANVFSKHEINKFLIEAPDETYLIHKVALIFGTVGACRREELYNIQTRDIFDTGKYLVVKIRNFNPNSASERTFTIIDRADEIVSYLDIYRKYINLRPKSMKNDHFFVNYRNGKCNSVKVGKGTIGSWPSKIAAFLNLPNKKNYTGHSFRATAAKLGTNFAAVTF